MIRVKRKLNSTDVVDALDRPVHPARTAGIHKIRQWRRIYRQEGARLDRRGGRQDGLHRTRSPWENGYCESFNARFRDELLNGEVFYSAA